MRTGAVIFVVLTAAVTQAECASRVSPAAKACVTTAYEDYNRANVAIMTQSGPLLSAESVITQRRLMEQYCSRFAQCVIGDPGNPSLKMPYAAAFASCLREEMAPDN
jgi:hypothetical protein